MALHYDCQPTEINLKEMRVSALWHLGPYSGGKWGGIPRHRSPERPKKLTDLLWTKGQPNSQPGGDNKGNIYQLHGRGSKEFIFMPRYFPISLMGLYSVASEGANASKRSGDREGSCHLSFGTQQLLKLSVSHSRGDALLPLTTESPRRPLSIHWGLSWIFFCLAPWDT